MIQYEDECVGCPAELGCLGDSCKYKNVPHYYCDECGDEGELYYYDNRELCLDCIEKELTPVR